MSMAVVVVLAVDATVKPSFAVVVAAVAGVFVLGSADNEVAPRRKPRDSFRLTGKWRKGKDRGSKRIALVLSEKSFSPQK